MQNQRAFSRALTLSVALTCVAFGAYAQMPPQGSPVSVVEISTAPVTVSSTLQGRASPYMVAEVRPQVSGLLQKRLFEEGAEVKAGQPLYQIDPETYEATRDAAAAELQRAEAQLFQAQSTAERIAKLVKSRAVSQQQDDDAQAALLQAKAAVAAAKAQLKAAEINLSYTTIKSPISGTIGRSSVTPGALLSGYQGNALATVRTLDPIYVDVSQASQELLRMRREIATGQLNAVNGEVPVELILEDGTRYPHRGTLGLSEVSVSEGTGTVTLRAKVPNPEKLLLPGMYVKARIPEGTRPAAILVPQRAVMRLNTGQPFVYVVKDGKAVQRGIQTERTSGVHWIVTEGLQPGEKVIVEGLQRVRPGVPVVIVPTEAEKVKAAQQKKAAQ